MKYSLRLLVFVLPFFALVSLHSVAKADNVSIADLPSTDDTASPTPTTDPTDTPSPSATPDPALPLPDTAGPSLWVVGSASVAMVALSAASLRKYRR